MKEGVIDSAEASPSPFPYSEPYTKKFTPFEAAPEIAAGKATAKVYFDKPVAIGEHPQFLDELDKVLTNISNAEENVEALQQIVLDIGDRVDLKAPEESMETITLFDSEKNLKKYLPLGLNDEYDQDMKFSPRDLVLVGGRRGAGKSLTCVNIATNVI